MEKIYPSQMQGQLTVDTLLQYGKLLEPTFRISDVKIDSKIYHSWRMAGLVDTVDDGKWAKFSFVEYVWLRNLESMRRLGCSVKTMKAVHEQFFIKAYKDNLAKKTLQDNIDTLTTISQTRPLTKDEEEILYHSRRTLADEILMSVTNYDITYFYQLVVKCFANNNEVGIIIYEDQTFNAYEKGASNVEGAEVLDLSVPHIMIPLTSYIKDFVVDEEKEKFLVPSGLITVEENKIINLIRDKNVKKLTITFNENNEPIKFETEDSGIIQGEKAKQIKQILGLKNYSAIELKTRDGNTLSYTLGKREF
jgi:hypothetical protein